MTGLNIQALVPGNEYFFLLRELASEYPLPHSLLGTEKAPEYVMKLATRFVDQQGAGWYGYICGNSISAAAHLSVYGFGNGRGHTLWKIRHPMLQTGCDPDHLGILLDFLVDHSLLSRSGSAKIVMFLSEFESIAIEEARAHSFILQGQLSDYYRIGEMCLIYTRTVFGQGKP